jgi:hypothetical protein
MQRRAAASAQCEPLLEALNDERLVDSIDVPRTADATGWEAVDAEIVAIREGLHRTARVRPRKSRAPVP